MIGDQPTDTIPRVHIQAVSHEGLTVTVNGKPGRLAIVTDDGEIIAAGKDVAREAEAEMASTSRSSPQGADAAWRELAEGVLAQDVQARLRARQLVADTFARIVVYHHGMRPDPQASARDYEIDLVLVAKGGTARLLRVTRQGDWRAGDDALALAAD